MKNSILKLIKRQPAIEDIARKIYSIVPFTNRIDKEFWSWYLLFNDMESWSPDRIREFQIDKLKQLLHVLESTNVYYGRFIRDIDIASIKSLHDFANVFPTISRLEYSTNYSDIKSSRLNGKFRLASTSGTTGSALQFYHSRQDEQREWAAICHQWKRVGYDPVKSVRAEFRGMTSHGRLVQNFPEENMIRCSILDISPTNMTRFAQAISSSGADYYHGYPSAIYLLAKEINKCGISFPQPKGLLLASEQVYQWQLEEIGKAFPRAMMIAHYGCAERVVLAGWCEFERIYHVLPQYSIVEIDEATNEIIGTNLFNAINPFIRYRMTDTVLKVSDSICEKCRRPYAPLIELSGRSEDFLFSPEKGWISPAIVTYPLKNLRAIREIRFVQGEDADITVQYTTYDNRTEDIKHEKATVDKGLRELVGKDLNIRYEHLDDMERSNTGKFKWIVSRYWETHKTDS